MYKTFKGALASNIASVASVCLFFLFRPSYEASTKLVSCFVVLSQSCVFPSHVLVVVAAILHCSD